MLLEVVGADRSTIESYDNIKDSYFQVKEMSPEQVAAFIKSHYVVSVTEKALDGRTDRMVGGISFEILDNKCYFRTLSADNDDAYANVIQSTLKGLQDLKVSALYAKTSATYQWQLYAQLGMVAIYARFTESAPRILLDFYQKNPTDQTLAVLPGWLGAAVVSAYNRPVHEQEEALRVSLNQLDQHLALYALLLNAKPTLGFLLSATSSSRQVESRWSDVTKIFNLPHGVLCIGFYKSCTPAPSAAGPLKKLFGRRDR